MRNRGNITNIQSKVRRELSGMEHVNGIGIGRSKDGHLFIKVNLTHEDRAVRAKVRQLSRAFSFPIRVAVVGFVKAF